MAESSPSLSIVVPLHNEETILVEQITGMVGGLRAEGVRFECLLIENGSTDGSAQQCLQLSERFQEVRVLSLPVGDFGLALREGILKAENEVVVIFNVEFWSVDFLHSALPLLGTHDLVIGSKAAPGAHDERPWLRRMVTRSFNLILALACGLEGTDTHGMKAFWRRKFAPLAEACVTDGFVFDTELVLRAQRAGLSKCELPTDVREMRAPSARSLARRVPSVLRNLWLLWRTLPRPSTSPTPRER